MPARPILFVVGLVLCLGGAITCATAPANEPHEFPTRSDKAVIGGLVLVVLGTAGREARGRQMLGRRSKRRVAPSSATPSPAAGADEGATASTDADPAVPHDS